MKARGFSLFEVTLAAAILLIGLASLASALPNLSHVHEHQRHLADAGTVAGNVLEEAIKLEDQRTLPEGRRVARYDARGILDVRGMYTSERVVTKDVPVENGKSIEVTVNWEEFGRERSYTLKSYAYRAPN